MIQQYGPEATVEFEADVAIVGSGAGGAPLAYELANEGYSVIVLEEGGYHTTRDFRFRASWASSHLFRDGGVTVTFGIPVVLAPVGRTVGGTTTVNQGTALRIPESLLKKWHLEYGLHEIKWDELCLYYAAVEEFLFVGKADPQVAGENARRFLEGASRLGLTGDYLPRNAKDCEGYASCSFGCPSGAKQSMVVSYIPEAVRKGARFFADCRVRDIMIENGRAAGFAGQFQEHASGAPGPRFRVHSKVSVVAAGAVGTPLLLFKNRLCNSSGQLGKNYHVHPAIITIPIFDDIIEPHNGISESAWVTDFEEYGFVLETTVLPPDMLAMVAPGIGLDHSGLMRHYLKSGFFAGMMRDSTGGRLVPLDRKAQRYAIYYNLNDEDLHNSKLSTIISVEIALAAGAREVYTYIHGHEILRSMRDVERLRRARIRGRQILAMSGWHPMGTCRMGSDPDASVVRHTHETWDVPDLFVVDASVFPTALGVNPQITIMAFSMRSAGFIDERLMEKGVRPGGTRKAPSIPESFEPVSEKSR